jgi:hypothetical protein
MEVYLICFAEGIARDARARVRHYIGWTGRQAEERLAEHKSGVGSPLVRAAVHAGLDPVITRTWPGMDRKFERFLKRQRNAARYCPACTPGAEERPIPRLAKTAAS